MGRQSNSISYDPHNLTAHATQPAFKSHNQIHAQATNRRIIQDLKVFFSSPVDNLVLMVLVAASCSIGLVSYIALASTSTGVSRRTERTRKCVREFGNTTVADYGHSTD